MLELRQTVVTGGRTYAPGTQMRVLDFSDSTLLRPAMFTLAAPDGRAIRVTTGAVYAV